jgi:hypothetical protein
MAAPKVPKYVYHYTEWQNLDNIAATGGLLMRSILKMNDPRESKDWNVGYLGDSAPDLTAEQVKEAMGGFRRRVKVISFSLGSDDETTERDRSGHGYAKPAMWAHYAGNHTGACLIFDRSRLHECVVRAMMSAVSEGGQLANREVRYVKDSFGDAAFYGIDTGMIGSLGLEAAVRHHFLSRWEDMFFVKHFDWSHENEYRWIAYDPDDRLPEVIDVAGSLTALVVGADFPVQELERTRHLAGLSSGGLRIFQCTWDRIVANLDPVEEVDGRLQVIRLPRLTATTKFRIEAQTSDKENDTI